MMKAIFVNFHPLPPTAYWGPTSMTVRKIISKHIQDLSKKQGQIERLRDLIWARRMVVLSMMQHEVLRSEPRVEHQLELLQKLAKEIKPAEQPCPSAPLNIIYKHLEDLNQQLVVISQIEETISPDVFITPTQMGILDTKTSVVYGIDVLRTVVEDVVFETELWMIS